eukprot:TRINITY_DN3281_c0_g1_i1.p1 TRINITY_DN3281_c0_g1~~TRINITY_DN3281_c0_g1_i1.p1  ORF type:complete len:467 (+),score=47.41 TRINITY_DN3281_c0_g1_i1:102-1502(+)
MENPCQSISDCSGNGVCESGTCKCIPAFRGMYCEEAWMESIPGWSECFTTFSVCLVVASAASLAFSSYQLWRYVFRPEHGQKRWTVVSQSLGVIAIGNIVRLILFAIDPYGYRGILPTPAVALMLNFSTVLWAIGGFLVMMYWCELVHLTGPSEMSSIHRFRPALVAFAIGTAVLLFPFGLWSKLTGSRPARILYNSFAVLICLFLIMFSATFGLRLRRMLIASLAVTQRHGTRPPPQEIFLRKLNRFVLSIAVSLSIFIIFIIGDTMDQSPWGALGLQVGARFSEVASVQALLMLLHRGSSKNRETPASPPTARATVRGSTAGLVANGVDPAVDQRHVLRQLSRREAASLGGIELSVASVLGSPLDSDTSEELEPLRTASQLELDDDDNAGHPWPVGQLTPPASPTLEPDRASPAIAGRRGSLGYSKSLPPQSWHVPRSLQRTVSKSHSFSDTRARRQPSGSLTP